MGTGSPRMRKLKDYRAIPPGRCLNCFLRRDRECMPLFFHPAMDGDVRHRLLIMFMFSHIPPSSHSLIFLCRFLQGVLRCVQVTSTDDPEVGSVCTWKPSYVRRDFARAWLREPLLRITFAFNDYICTDK